MLSTQEASADDRSKIDQNVHTKKSKLWNFIFHTWNHHEKCIEISTNIPGIGSLIFEIAVTIWESWESKHSFAHKLTNACVPSFKLYFCDLCFVGAAEPCRAIGRGQATRSVQGLYRPAPLIPLQPRDAPVYQRPNMVSACMPLYGYIEELCNLSEMCLCEPHNRQLVELGLEGTTTHWF